MLMKIDVFGVKNGTKRSTGPNVNLLGPKRENPHPNMSSCLWARAPPKLWGYYGNRAPRPGPRWGPGPGWSWSTSDFGEIDFRNDRLRFNFNVRSISWDYSRPFRHYFPKAQCVCKKHRYWSTSDFGEIDFKNDRLQLNSNANPTAWDDAMPF